MRKLLNLLLVFFCFNKGFCYTNISPKLNQILPEIDTNYLVITCNGDVEKELKLGKRSYKGGVIYLYSGIEKKLENINTILNDNQSIEFLRLDFRGLITYTPLNLNLSKLSKLEISFMENDSFFLALGCLSNLKEIRLIQCRIGNLKESVSVLESMAKSLDGIYFWYCNFGESINEDLGALSYLNLGWISIFDENLKTLSCELLKNKKLKQINLLHTPRLILPDCFIIVKHGVKLYSNDDKFIKKNKHIFRE